MLSNESDINDWKIRSLKDLSPEERAQIRREVEEAKRTGVIVEVGSVYSRKWVDVSPVLVAQPAPTLAADDEDWKPRSLKDLSMEERAQIRREVEEAKRAGVIVEVGSVFTRNFVDVNPVPAK